MKTGVVVLGKHSADEGERAVAEKCAGYLERRGRKNVRVAYHSGRPRSDEVIEEMFAADGVDTFCILPLAIAEGDMTTWLMPRRLGLPDSSGSWRMVGEHDVATRFATAMGGSEAMAAAVLRRIGEPRRETGVLVLAHGSKLSQSEKVAEYYASKAASAGWRCRTAFTRFGPRDVGGAVSDLVSEGCSDVVLVPLFISVTGASYADALADLESTGIGFVETGPVSGYPEFMEILDSKVPKGW